MRRIAIRGGFSLVELMIVVAIIGILAAIAVPLWRQMQLKSRLAEVPTNVSGIRTAEFAYQATNDAYFPCAPTPAAIPGATAVVFNGTGTGFDTVGWAPDGMVRGQYAVQHVMMSDIFHVMVTTDLDEDGFSQQYHADTVTTLEKLQDEDVY